MKFCLRCLQEAAIAEIPAYRFGGRRPQLMTTLVTCISIVLLLLSVAANAQDAKCTFSMSNISFGTVDLQSGSPYDAAGNFTYACTGDAREIIRICPSWGMADDGTRFMTDAAGDKLVYNLYTDADRHTVWGTWYSKNTKGASIDLPVGRTQKISGTVPVYGRIAANQQKLAPGAYAATINKGNAAVSYGYASKGSCESMKHGDRVSVGMTISANVKGGEVGPGAITAPDATKPNPGPAPPANPGQADEKKSLMQKLKENAEYQQQKQNQAASGNSDSQNSNSTESKQAERAKYIETHACMTTDGADKANQLADDCNKVTTGSHDGCNIQENTCDEIRKTTQKGCWGMAASAPDFCFTKYR